MSFVWDGGRSFPGDSVRVTEENAVADFDNDGFVSSEGGLGFESHFYTSDFGQYLFSLHRLLAEDPPFDYLPYGNGQHPADLFRYHVFRRHDYPPRFRGREYSPFVLYPATKVLDGLPGDLADYPPAPHSFCGEADRYIRSGGD